MLHAWGCGRFGQHGKDTDANVSVEDSTVDDLKDETVKLVGCGASHTLVFTGLYPQLFKFINPFNYLCQNDT